MWFAPSLEIDSSYSGFGGGFGFGYDYPNISIEMPRLPPISIGGGGASREQAVRIVNWYESQFARNRDEYRAGKISATRAQQTFAQLWRDMESMLAPLGVEGERALADRRPGGKYDWHRTYDYFTSDLGAGSLTPSPSLPLPSGLPPGFSAPEASSNGLSVGGLIVIGLLAWLAFG